MDLRVIAVLVMYAIAAAYALSGGAFAALLVYVWLGYFRPDHWAGWSVFIRQIPMSYAVGIYLVVTTLLAPNVKLMPRGWAWVMLGFAAHTCLSLALTPVDLTRLPWAWWGCRLFAQSIVIAVVMTLLVTDRHRFRLLVLVMALALSIEAAKQGWVMLLLDSSETNINDIPFLGDNNHVAVGVLMMAAVLGALVSVGRRRAEKLFFALLLVGMLFRSLTTYSRGGFLALGALAIVGLAYSRRRLLYLTLGAATAFILFSALPASFWTRMETITPNAAGATGTVETPDEDLDTSAQSRVHFWRVAVEMAADRPLLGFGFLLYQEMYDRYDFSEGAYGRKRAVHSAWFGALADTGVVGFLWFITILGGAILATWRVQWLARAHPELHELGRYAAGLNAAFFTYIVGASFVTLTYSDLLWHMMTLAFILHRIAKAEVAALAGGAPAPAAVSHGVRSVPPARPAAVVGAPSPVRAAP